jgi:hypothetical protein
MHWLRVAPVLQLPRRHDGRDQQDRSQPQQSFMADPLDQRDADQRADQAAQARARGHQRERALGLRRGNQVDQHAPNHRDGDQVEHRDPDVERARDPQVLRLPAEADREQHQVGGEEPERPRQDATPLHASGDPAEQRHRRQRRQERAGEQPLQVLHATGNSHRLAHRTQHEISGEQQEEHQLRDQHRRQFVFGNAEQPCHPRHALAHRTQPSAATSAARCLSSSIGPVPAFRLSS